MKNLIIFIILVISLLASTNLVVDQDTNILIDPHGQFRIFHGVNVVYKPAPYYPPYNTTFNPEDSFCEEDAQNLVNWGFNVVRLYIAWEGVEPTEGNFNQEYIQHIQNIVEMLKKYNIAVFLDMHQDLYSNFFCGEGLPRWAVESVISQNDQDFPKPLNIELKKDSQGYPEVTDCHKSAFFKYYFTYDVQKIGQDLLRNVGGLTDKFANFWEYVAKNFKNYENLLGYELINEPFGIDLYENPISKLLPGSQNNEALIPFYQALNKKIRGVDKESLIFYEPVTWDFINAGFETNVGGPQYKNREVLSYHIYCPLVNANGEPTNQLACSIFDSYQSKGKEHNYQKIGVAGFLTEFGALDNSDGSAKEVDRLTGNADKIFNSWTYWQYKFFHDITTAAQSPDAEGFWNSKGELQTTKVGALSRSYAYQICGNPEKMTWSRSSQKFTLEYQLNRTKCPSGSTEVYLSEYFFFQNGFQPTFKNCPGCSLQATSQGKGYYKIVGDDKVADQTMITLTVTHKK